MPERPPSPEPSGPAAPPADEGGDPAAPEEERGVLRPDVSAVNEGAPAAPGADDPHDAAPSMPRAAAFSGPRGRLLWILVRNLLLNALTLGFFRFWAKTHLRRYFWRHTKLLGEPLEYTGTGGELFIGFLIVMAVLAPLIGLASLAQLFVEHIAVNFIVPAVLFALTPIAVFRMWRYRFTRTLWRGVRFGLDGSSLRYAGLWLGYGALTVVTLGLANPWRRVVTTRYLIGHARFGVTRLSLAVRGGRMFLPWLAVTAALTAAVGVLAATNAQPLFELWTTARDAAAAGRPVPGSTIEEIAGRLRLWPLVLLIVPVLAYARYRAVEFRYLLDNVRAGEARLRSSLGTGFFVAVHVLGWTLVLAVALGVPGLSFYAIAVGDLPEGAFPGVLIAFFVIWVLLVLVLNLAYILIVNVTILAHACRTLAIENPATLDDIAQSSAASLRRGEGLADALDVGGF